MAQTCRVCTHRERSAIDAAVVAGESNRRIAAQYGLSEASVRRHASNHLVADVARAQETRGLDVLEQLRAINIAALEVLAKARVSGDGRLVLQACDRVLDQLNLQARLLGQLEASTTTVNVNFAVEWPALRWRIVQALDAFPDARQSVLSALASANGEHNGVAH